MATRYRFENDTTTNKSQGSCVNTNCPKKDECPLFNNYCEAYCDILKTLESYEIGLEDGRKPLKSTALILAQTKGSFLGYHLIFYKKFKALQNMIMYKGQVFVDKKCDGEQTKTPLPELQGEDLSKSICFKAFLKLSNSNEWTPLVVIENAKGNQYINYSIIYKDATGTRISITRDTEFELVYLYSIPNHLFGSYLNRTLSFFYEDTDISFFADMSKLSQIDFKLRIMTLSNEGKKIPSTATGIDESTIDKKSIWADICKMLNTDLQSIIIKELQSRIKNLYFGKTFILTETTITEMEKQKSRNIELSWNPSVLFSGDNKTVGNVSSTITNK